MVRSKSGWDPNKLGNSERVQFKSKGNRRIPPCSGEGNLCFIKLSDDWMTHHMLEVNLHYSKSTDLNVKLIQNMLTETFTIMFYQIFGYCGPAKLARQTNHHNV